MYAYNFRGHRYDVGSKMGFIQANIEFALRREELKEEMQQYLQELYARMDEMLEYD